MTDPAQAGERSAPTPDSARAAVARGEARLRRTWASRSFLRFVRRGQRDAALARLRSDGNPTVAAAGRALTAAVAPPSGDELRWIERIEGVRAALGSSDEVLPSLRVRTPGGEVDPLAVDARVSHLALDVSKPARWGRVLLNLARELRPAWSLELGTCIGLSTAYQAAGLDLGGGEGRVVTLELRAPRVKLAEKNLERVGLARRVRALPGDFDETLDHALGITDDLGFAFIDGHHRKRPTVRYFKRIAAKMRRAGGVVLFDDITWSRGMRRAWREISQDPRVALAADLSGLGLCVVRGVGNGSSGVPHSLDMVLYP
jgi:predicted O-methyltransferase YrrM